jgi:RimJ/RimL family protein N-acetyltransferase
MELVIGEWKIRSWKPEDETAIVKYANNRNISINLRDSFPFPYTLQDARTWLRKISKQQPETAFAIANADEAIGGIGLHMQRDVFRHSAEIGYWLGEPFWGRGIATLAVRAFTEFVFASFGLTRIFAGVFDGNTASIRVLEKSGYQLEGRMRNAVVKDGRVLDQLIYAILFSDMKSHA